MKGKQRKGFTQQNTKQALPIHNQFPIKKCLIKQFNKNLFHSLNGSFSFDAWPGGSWWVHTWSAPTLPFRHAETPRQVGMPTYQRCIAAGPCRYRARLRAMQIFSPGKFPDGNPNCSVYGLFTYKTGSFRGKCR